MTLYRMFSCLHLRREGKVKVGELQSLSNIHLTCSRFSVLITRKVRAVIPISTYLKFLRGTVVESNRVEEAAKDG